MKSKILVAYASKHGATAEIAERIGKVIREAGFEVDIFPVGRAGDLGAYGAVVLGSAIYIGQWRKEAANDAVIYRADGCVVVSRWQTF